MASSPQARDWTVEEVGENHALLCLEGVPGFFLVPSILVPPGTCEGDRLETFPQPATASVWVGTGLTSSRHGFEAA